MADNLKILKQNLDAAINPAAGVGQITAQGHNDVFTEFINKSGKYTGFPFKAISSGTNYIFPIGTFSFEDNPFNNTNPFNLIINTINLDKSNMTVVLNELKEGDIIKFKDFVGRVAYFKIISFLSQKDAIDNDIVIFNVVGFNQNSNYTYQPNEEEICVLEFLKSKTDIPTDTTSLQNLGSDGTSTYVEHDEIKSLATNGIVVKDNNGAVIGNIDDFVKLKGANFNDATKTFEVLPLTPNTVFLKGTGTDASAEPNNEAKPFKTLDGACSWLLSQPHKGLGWTIMPLDNGTYSYTLSDTSGANPVPCVFDGFNITNISNATIQLKQSITVNVENKFYFPTGKLIFVVDDNYVGYAYGSFIYNVNNNINFYHYVIYVRMTNLSSTNKNLDRGLFRHLGNVEEFTWFTLVMDDKTWKVSDKLPLNDKKINILNITNACTNGTSGTKPFNAYQGFYDLKILNYTNTSINHHYINAKNLEMADMGCTSVGGVINLDCYNVSILKDCVWKEVRVVHNLLGKRKLINGNSFIVTIDNTATTYMMYMNGAGRSVMDGYDADNYVMFKDVKFKETVANTLSVMFQVDFRTGRSGEIILDNFELVGGCNLMKLVNTSGTDIPTKSHVLIFRNDNRILNGLPLFQGTAPVGTQADLIVQENASIYHDNATIGGGVNMQTTIPNISTY